ncbi:MAG: peptidase C1 [Bacteroidia bacterium]|nr:peptidase C1 [Bacteroidia bacterium]
MNRKFIITLLSLITLTVVAQERKDKATFKPYVNAFYEQIKKANETFYSEKKEPSKRFLMDYSTIDVPKSATEFKTVWAHKPVSQGETNTCWSYSTISFYEAEITRLTKQTIRLSEAFIVYWQYVEKAREFVRTRGKSLFDEGSESNAVTFMMRKYGAVPGYAYTGVKPGQQYPDHSKMIAELKAYMQSVKTANAWGEEQVVGTVKGIMNFYLGEPPAEVTVDDKKFTPKEYLAAICKLNPDDYVDFMSLMEAPYWTQAEYKVPDNWNHSNDYYNVPLDDFMAIVKSAIKKDYSMSIGGDVSESGISSYTGVMMVPTYDIPSQYIDENARELRFLNGATTDDHGMHLVGYLEKPNGTWFLIKDSGSGGHNNVNSPGYYYMHEDFVKLKMMNITVHKDAVKEYIEKFPDRRMIKYTK